MDDQLKKFSQAVIQGATQSGPASYIPELTSYFTADARKGLSDSATGGASTAISAKADAEQKAAEISRQQQISKLQDQLDPSKYRKVRKSDGGFDFFDPNGNRIDISTFANRTGQDRASILKDSDNPIDREFVNDYSNMNDLMQAVHNGDTQTVNSFKQQNPQLASTTPDDLMKQLINKYPHLFGAGSYQQTYNNRNARVFQQPAYGASSGGLMSLGQ